MAAYLIGTITVRDPEAWQAYVAQVGATFGPFNGRVIFRGEKAIASVRRGPRPARGGRGVSGPRLAPALARVAAIPGADRLAESGRRGGAHRVRGLTGTWPSTRAAWVRSTAPGRPTGAFTGGVGRRRHDDAGGRRAKKNAPVGEPTGALRCVALHDDDYFFFTSGPSVPLGSTLRTSGPSVPFSFTFGAADEAVFFLALRTSGPSVPLGSTLRTSGPRYPSPGRQTRRSSSWPCAHPAPRCPCPRPWRTSGPRSPYGRGAAGAGVPWANTGPTTATAKSTATNTTRPSSWDTLLSDPIRCDPRRSVEGPAARRCHARTPQVPLGGPVDANGSTKEHDLCQGRPAGVPGPPDRPRGRAGGELRGGRAARRIPPRAGGIAGYSKRGRPTRNAARGGGRRQRQG